MVAVSRRVDIADVAVWIPHCQQSLAGLAEAGSEMQNGFQIAGEGPDDDDADEFVIENERAGQTESELVALQEEEPGDGVRFSVAEENLVAPIRSDLGRVG